MLKSHVHVIVKAVALAAAAAALAWYATDAHAASRLDVPRPAEARPASVPDGDLEDIFWLCDYAATVGFVDPDDRESCSAITDRLKAERFGGDFERMLEWWQANRTVRHQRLDETGDAPR
jgi:hypothetical protein